MMLRSRIVVPPGGLALYAGAALAVAALVLGIIAPGAMAGWLAGAVLFSAVPAGSLYLMMMMRLIPGAWGEELRLSSEAAGLLTPWATLTWIPVLLALSAIYPWMHGAKLSGMQQVVLSPIFFILLTAVRFAAILWIGARMSWRQAAMATSAAGLIALPLLGTVAAFVWLLSLDPKFASSAFGLQFLEREFTVAMAVLVLLRLSIGRPPRKLWVLGGVLLTLLLIWAYIEYLSFFINWSTNSPDGAHWYLRRGAGGWGALLWVWGAASGIPLLALLFGQVRNSARMLRWICVAVILGKACEMAWVTLPGFGLAGIGGYLLTLAALSLVTLAALPAALRQRVDARRPKGSAA